ncbi:AraC family transcriptional regulator [Chryseobacterium sp. G0186]|uniref:helix-turn-helix domain-containing protein n=1 Tax=Chryseobacterium sp. G0186 TaxID=2487064 RepID=UPI000F501186|nr:helix-turn-helix transcriptional regulator [Chryseobacterium sp. G0186]AZA76460.1 AraC family transcriptional regulator [Chryseobacterium sp. G0186]
MKNKINPPQVLTISKVHQLLKIKKPTNPLVSVIDLSTITIDTDEIEKKISYNFFSIALKKNCDGFGYGQQHYDFNEGVMSFIAPEQIISPDKKVDIQPEGMLLIVHPDFFRHYPLAKIIRSYGFFFYEVNEGLYLSESENEMVIEIMKNISKEISNSIDAFTQDLIVSHIELLLKYCDRFYNRQFLTRKMVTSDILAKVEDLLDQCFTEKDLKLHGVPTVNFLASKMNMSPNYLTDMLRTLTGKTTQQHIQNKIIEKAKILLSTTNLTVSEIAYSLGFDYPQSFQRLFKNLAKTSPLEFRNNYN